MIHELLENGVEVVIKENHFSQAASIQCWVGTGSIHEGPTERGMAHFLEHMLFKGTKKRAVGEIAATVEACGGDINAYTTFDHTVYYLTLASPHAAIGVDLLADAVLNSTLDVTEFEREREVIIEEIRRGLDSPGGKVGRKIFEISFAGSEAGRPIIGSEESVKSFKRDDLNAFYKRWYQPKNMTVLIVGNVDTKAMLELVREHFGRVSSAEVPTFPKLALPRHAATGLRSQGKIEPQVSILRGDYKQPRLEMVFPAPDMEHPDIVALDMATFALGSGEMSRLNRRLRDQEGIVTSVGASVYAPQFGGIFEMSAFMALDQITAAVTSLTREAMLIRTKEPITEDELARARANLRADRLHRDETVDGQAKSIGYGLRTSHKLLYDEVYTTLVNTMQPNLVSGAVRRWLDPSKVVIVALLPEDATHITEKDLAAAFVKGVDQVLDKSDDITKYLGKSSTTVKSKADADLFELAPGLNLVYRHNPDAHLFTITAASEGGLRGETEDTAGLYYSMSGLMATATESLPYEKLVGIVESLGASLEGFSGKDSFGFHMQCLTEQTDQLLGLMASCMLEPVFPEEQWLSMKREIEQSIAAQDDSPSGVCVRRFQEAIFGAHPYRHPVYGTKDSIKSYSPQSLLSAFKTQRDGGPWTIAATGSMRPDQAAKLLADSLKSLRPKASKRVFASDQLITPPKPGRHDLTKEREQAHIVYGFKGLTWADKDRVALDVMTNVLGGHGGRLFSNLRDRDSLAYTVSPIISYGCHPGILGSYIACAPSKVEQALRGLKAEMAGIGEVPPTAAEVDRSRNYIIGSHDMGLQRSDSQTSTMALMALYGYGYDDFLRYPKAIAKVTPEDVQRVAQRLIDDTKAVTVIVGPKGT